MEEAARAVSAHRHAAGLDGQIGDEPGLAGHVESLLALLLHTAPAHFFDETRFDAGAADVRSEPASMGAGADIVNISSSGFPPKRS